jgi:hypothetical protein
MDRSSMARTTMLHEPSFPADLSCKMAGAKKLTARFSSA